MTARSRLPVELAQLGPVPANVTGSGRELWAGVRRAGFWLGPDEVALLTRACRVSMIIDALQEQIDEVLESGEVFTVGSTGQPTMNPLFAEVRQQTEVLQKIIRQLKLPVGEVADDQLPATRRRPSNEESRRLAHVESRRAEGY